MKPVHKYHIPYNDLISRLREEDSYQVIADIIGSVCSHAWTIDMVQTHVGPNGSVTREPALVFQSEIDYNTVRLIYT